MSETEIKVWKPPTITELIQLADEENNTTMLKHMAGLDAFNLSINQAPPTRWIKQHPILRIKVGEKDGHDLTEPYQYMPIEMHRLLAKRFFGHVEEEILREGVMFQSVYCAVRIHYFHPILNKMCFQDGIGAVDAQTKKGSSAFDLVNINPGAIQKGLPAAASFAFNNAYKKLGKIFGQDIQKDAQPFNEQVAMYFKEVKSTDVSDDVKKSQVDALSKLKNATK